MRKTRRDRYNEKIANGEVKTFPFSLCAVNFQCDENIAYLIRTAACFGLGSSGVGLHSALFHSPRSAQEKWSGRIKQLPREIQLGGRGFRAETTEKVTYLA